MIDERPLRIWIDDHNPIFRLGLGAKNRVQAVAEGIRQGLI